MQPDPLVDAAGQRHLPAQAAPRIVSLVPSLTELLCALELREHLVGRTGFCIHPREALRAVPKVGGTKDVDLARVRALAPTHLVVNIDENEKPTVDALRAHVGSVVVTHPVSVEDNFALYALFGALFHRQAQAGLLAEALRAALERVGADGFAPLRVLYLIWREPWMTVGPDTYIARMLASVGLQAVSPVSTRRYPEVDFARFDASHFDAVLLSTEPYRFGETHLHALRADPRTGGRPVWLIDGEMTSWYGARAIEGLHYLHRFRRSMQSSPAAGAAG